MTNEEYLTPLLMKKGLFEYALDSIENFELKKNGTNNRVFLLL